MKENNFNRKVEEFYEELQGDIDEVILKMAERIKEEIDYDFEFTSHLLISLNQAIEDYFYDLKQELSFTKDIDIKTLHNVYEALFAPKHFSLYYEILTDYALTYNKYREALACLNLTQRYGYREVYELASAAIMGILEKEEEDYNFETELNFIKQKSFAKVGLSTKHRSYVRHINKKAQENNHQLFEVLAGQTLECAKDLKASSILVS